MNPPADLPPELVLLGEAFARRADIDPGDWWDYVYRRKPWPPAVRAGLVDAFSPLLTSAGDRTNVRHSMQALAGIDRRRKVGRTLDTSHPFTKWLAACNVTVTEWAEAHQYKRERVKSWFAESDGGRTIPRLTADLIAKESTDPDTGRCAVPATRRTWKNGIRE